MTRGPSSPAARAGIAVATAIPAALLLVFFVWPVVAMLARGFAPEALETLVKPRTWRLVRTTLWMAFAGTAGSVLLGVPAAYALYVCRFPGRRLLRSMATIPFVLPTVVVGVAFSSLLGKGGAYEFLGIDKTSWAVVAGMVFFNMSVIIRTVGTLWAGLDTRIADAARMLGAGPVRVLRTVTLPALAPAIAAGASLVFLFCSTAYGIVMTLGGVSTLESEIWSQTTRLNFDAAAALSLVQFVVVAAALAVSSRIGRANAQRMKASAEHPLRRADMPAFLVTVVAVLVLIVAPIASLVARSLRVDGEWSLAYYRALASTGQGFSGGATAFEALGNSARSAVVASLIALAIGIPLAIALSRPVRSRRHGAGQRVLEALATAPLGVSAVTVGFGFLITLQVAPLYLGDEAVPIAQAIVAVPMVLRALLPVLRSIEPGLREAAASLGCGPARVLWTVDLPLAKRALALAAGFALAISLGEFGASSFLASGQNITLPVLISRLISRPGGNNFGMALAASVILGLVTALIMAACETGRRRDAS